MKKILLILFLVSFSFISKSQDNNATTKKDTIRTINDFYIDFSIPDLSAFNMIGTTPTNVLKPGTVREFSAAILNVVSGGSQITPGLAIEWSPYLSFKKHSSNQLVKYRKNPISGMQFTFGTLQDTLGSKVGYGLKWTIIDNSDPIRDIELQDYVISLQKKYLETNPISNIIRQTFDINKNRTFKIINNICKLEGNPIKENLNKFFIIDETVPKPDYLILLKKCNNIIDSLTSNNFLKNDTIKSELILIIENYINIIEERDFNNSKNINLLLNSITDSISNYKKNNWNKMAMQVGLGHSLVSNDYKWRSLKNDKVSCYYSFKHPVYNSANKGFGIQNTYYLQYNNSSNKDTLAISNLLFAGARILFGSNEFRFSLEGSYNYISKNYTNDENNIRITGGFEFEFQEGIWLELVVGANSSIDSFRNASFLSLFNLKYALTKQKRKFN